MKPGRKANLKAQSLTTVFPNMGPLPPLQITKGNRGGIPLLPINVTFYVVEIVGIESFLLLTLPMKILHLPMKVILHRKMKVTAKGNNLEGAHPYILR